LDYSGIFRRDLDRLLALVGAGPQDVVYLPTAHGREALAVRRIIDELGEENAPEFHLVFRHALAEPGPARDIQEDPWVVSYTHTHRAFFDACRAYPDTRRWHFYTDTDELTQEYGRLAGLPFGTVPIPFRRELIPPAPRRQGPLKVLFLGDPRQEKGFHLLPALVRGLLDDYLKTGKAQFVIQASIHHSEKDPLLTDALAELSRHDPRHVRLVGLEGFLPPETYYRLVAECDVMLLPYRPVAYRSRSSGVFAEAVSAGKPTVVPANTWLARQQLPGSGEAYTDPASFAGALRRICDDYDAYRVRAAEAQERWLAWHSPANLLGCLIGAESTRRAAA
jgi:glycosyltransferase involved in cell wall biosynthesis